MAIAELKWRRVALEILRLVHECDAGMANGVKYYQAAVAKGDATEATNQLKRAVRLPFRVEARIQAMVDKHGAQTINAALSQVSSVTLSDIQAELSPLKTYSDTLKDNYQNQGWSQEQIATDIVTNRASLDRDENVPIPVNYVDDM